MHPMLNLSPYQHTIGSLIPHAAESLEADRVDVASPLPQYGPPVRVRGTTSDAQDSCGPQGPRASGVSGNGKKLETTNGLVCAVAPLPPRRLKWRFGSLLRADGPKGVRM